MQGAERKVTRDILHSAFDILHRDKAASAVDTV
jgi:hypothetical protein